MGRVPVLLGACSASCCSSRCGQKIESVSHRSPDASAAEGMGIEVDLALPVSRDPVTGPDHRMARQAEGDPLRQRARVHQWRTATVGREQRHQAGLHPARQTAAERTSSATTAQCGKTGSLTAVRFDGRGRVEPLVVDNQPRVPEHGARRNHPDAKIGFGRLAPRLGQL